MSDTAHALVTKQFGPRAAAYVQSAVHAQGEDLDALAGFAQKHRFGRALDLGCGGGHVSFTIAPFTGAVVAYDLSEEMLAAVTREAGRRGLTNIATQQGPAETLPFPDASFDFVATRYSAHHWHDLAAGLREAHRVLKPGGHALFMDAVAPESVLLDTFLQTIELLRDPSHVRDYTCAQWHAALADAGFTPEAPVRRHVHLDFATWIARMKTPELSAQAILALQAKMPAEVKEHFRIEADGSFALGTMSMAARA